MAGMSYLGNIERYHEYRSAIHELLGSILTGVSEIRLFTDERALRQALCDIAEHYPFVDMLFTLDIHGVQSSENVVCQTRGRAEPAPGMGKDRSQRPYFLLAHASDRVVVTDPYLSTASRNLCVSAALKCLDAEGRALGYVVLDIDLGATIEFLMGDTDRRRFVPAFRLVYSLIVLGLFAVVAVLIYGAFREIATLATGDGDQAQLHLKPFGVVIFLTLGLAVFDLGKTILEEEVLMHKDIFRHSSTRRTITRFIAAILIAVSIEALLMMFRSALGTGEDMAAGVAMMATAVGLLLGLGIYVYLGARAEAILLSHRPSATSGRQMSPAPRT
jgi:hypothetical protein